MPQPPQLPVESANLLGSIQYASSRGDVQHTSPGAQDTPQPPQFVVSKGVHVPLQQVCCDVSLQHCPPQQLKPAKQRLLQALQCSSLLFKSTHRGSLQTPTGVHGVHNSCPGGHVHTPLSQVCPPEQTLSQEPQFWPVSKE